MLQIPACVKKLFYQDCVRKNCRIEFPNGERDDIINDQIVAESLSMTESICSRGTLKFGLVEPSKLQVTVVNVENIKGYKIRVWLEVDCSSLTAEEIAENAEEREDLDYPIYPVPYGVYTVDSCEREAGSRKRKIVAYSKEISELGEIELNIPFKKTFSTFSTWKASTLTFTDEDILTLAFPELTNSVSRKMFMGLHDVSSGTTSPRAVTQFDVQYIFSQKNKGGFSLPIGTVTSYPITVGYKGGYLPANGDYVIEVSRSFVDSDIDGKWNDDVSIAVSMFDLPEMPSDISDILGQIHSLCGDAFIEMESELKKALTSYMRHTVLRNCYVETKFNQYNVKFFSKEPLVEYQNHEYVTSGKNVGIAIDAHYEEYSASNVFSRAYFPYYRDIYKDPMQSMSSNLYSAPRSLRIYRRENDRFVQLAQIILPYSPSACNCKQKVICTNEGFREISKHKTAQKSSQVYTRSDAGTPTLANITSHKFTDIDFSSLNVRNIADANAEIKGRFVRFDRVEGDLTYISISRGIGIYPSETLYPAEDIYPTQSEGVYEKGAYMSAWYDDVQKAQFGKITCSYKDTNNEDAYLEKIIREDADGVFQAYDISDNEIIREGTFTEAKIQQILDTMAENIEGVPAYMPCNVKAIGLPFLECGDGVDFVTEDGIISTFIARRTISGIQHLVDTIESR